MLVKGKNKTKSFIGPSERQKRLANLIYLEIDRILFDLQNRKELLFRLWSKERVREPLIKVLRSHYYEMNFGQSILFPNELNTAIDKFYRTLDEFTFYISWACRPTLLT